MVHEVWLAKNLFPFGAESGEGQFKQHLVAANCGVQKRPVELLDQQYYTVYTFMLHQYGANRFWSLGINMINLVSAWVLLSGFSKNHV